MFGSWKREAWQARKSRPVQVCAVLVVGGLAAIAVTVTSGHRAATVSRAPEALPPRPRGRRPRDITASFLECVYQHGATRDPIGDSSNSFAVRGTKAAGRKVCAPLQAAAERLQHTQAYADDAVATAVLTERAHACVQAHGIALSSPSATLEKGTCRERLEAREGIVKPAPLP